MCPNPHRQCPQEKLNQRKGDVRGEIAEERVANPYILFHTAILNAIQAAERTCKTTAADTVDLKILENGLQSLSSLFEKVVRHGLTLLHTD